MEHNEINIKELIRKQILGQLDAEEAALLEREKARYSEEEYDGMIIEELRHLEGQLPPDPLDDWEPDFEHIIRRGNELRSKRRRNLYMEWGAAVAMWLMIGGTVVYLFATKQEIKDILLLDVACGHLEGNTEIPVLESSCVILLGDSTLIRVDQDQFGIIQQIGDLVISRTDAGLLRLKRNAMDGQEAPSTIKDVMIYTGARQQCVMELEDGTLVRLNAQSYIRYPLLKKDSLSIGFSGEAYVQALGDDDGRPLAIATRNGKVTVQEGDFVVRSTEDYTKAVLNTGELDLYSYKLKEAVTLRCPNDFGMISPSANSPKQAPRDSLISASNVDFEVAKMWTKVVRTYEDIPLRAFVDEMSRWEGFTIKDWQCVPKDKKINVSVCYLNDRKEVYAAIRKAGVLLYEEKGMISFCAEDNNRRIVFKEWNSGDKSYTGHKLERSVQDEWR